MADLPPGFQIPTPRPGRPSRPAIVSFAGWVLVLAGVLTSLGGLFLLAAGDAGTRSGAVGLVALGVAELVTGVEVLRLSPVFRVIGMMIAAIGGIVDVSQLVHGYRWQAVALILHAGALFALATQAEAFRPQE